MWHRRYEDARVSVQLFQLNYLGALCVKDWSFLEDEYCYSSSYNNDGRAGTEVMIFSTTAITEGTPGGCFTVEG